MNSYRSLEGALKKAIEDVPDFPQAGVVFKELGPVWVNPNLRAKAVSAVAEWIQSTGSKLKAIADIESRVLLLDMSLADRLNVPFVTLRKAGELPSPTVRESYELEYGTAVLECQVGAFDSSDELLIHDDVLATNGTASAAALLDHSGAQPVGLLVFGEFERFKWERATADEVPRGTFPLPSIGVA